MKGMHKGVRHHVRTVTQMVSTPLPCTSMGLVCEFMWEFLKILLKENMTGLKMDTVHRKSHKE